MRIAMAGFQHETNTFSNIKTTYQNFVEADSWPGMLIGNEIMKVMPKKAISISGFIDAAHQDNQDNQNELIPLIWCSATPSGHVEQIAFDQIVTQLLTLLSNANASKDGILDAIYLDLHGAMVSEEIEDTEGHLLACIRAIYPHIPIMVSLDFHANISEKMVQNATRLLIGQKTYHALRALQNTSNRCYKAFLKLPYLVPMTAQCTLSDPCKTIYHDIAAYEKKHTNVEIELAMGFPLSDIETIGPALIIYADTQEQANATLKEWYAYLLKQRSQFHAQYYSEKEAVTRAFTTNHKKIIFVDTQDNPGCGGTSDTTGLLAEMIHQKLPKSLLGILCDPDAAQKAHEVGIGAAFPFALGAKADHQHCKPLMNNFKVRHLSNGKFTATGPFYLNIKMDLGLMAVLEVGGETGVHIVVSSKKAQAADQMMFRHLGIQLEDYKVIALKSSVHYQADFNRLSNEHWIVISPGMNVADIKTLTYHRKPQDISCI